MISKLARGRRLGAALVVGGLLAALVGVATPGPAEGVAAPATGVSAFVNGVLAHAHAVSVPDPKLANVNEAFNVSAVNSGGLTSRLVSEVNDAIEPQAGKNAYARGGGVDVGVGSASPTNINGEPISLSIAESSAPTAAPPYTTGLVNNVQTIDLEGALDPVANASALGGRSATLWNPNYLFPTLGNPLTYAYGQAASVEALNTGDGLDQLNRFLQGALSTISPDDPDRTTGSSQSFTYLVNNGDGTCGIASEIHTTIAPVNIDLLGITIEVAGDWVMKGLVTGKPDNPATANVNEGGYLKYGPSAGGTAVLRALDNAAPADPPLFELLTQTLLGDTGLAEQLDALDPLADVSVGADARAISPPNADGTATVPNDTSAPVVSSTRVAGAADVVRLKLLSALAPLDAADLRIGHFEMDLRVPAGGANCEIPVGKTSSVPIAQTGNDLTFQIKIPIDPNAVKPFPCDLTNVKVTDVLKLEKADTPSNPPRIDLVSGTGPKGEVGVVSADKQSISFANIGAWKPGDPPLVVTIKAKVPTTSGTGIVRDEAEASATPANCKASNSVLANVIGLITGDVSGSLAGTFFGKDGVGLTGRVIGEGPVSVTGKGVLRGPEVAKAQILSVTGRNDAIYLGLALAALASTFGLVKVRRRLASS